MKTLTITLNETQLDFVRQLVEDARDGVKDRLKPIGDPVAALEFDPILEAINAANSSWISGFDLAESPDQHVETWTRVPVVEESPETVAQIVEVAKSVSPSDLQVQTAVVEIKSDQNVEPVGESGVGRPDAPSGNYGSATHWLRAAQQNTGLTGKQMAKILDIGESSYSAWKAGKWAPSFWRESLKKFCDLFEWDMAKVDQPLPGPIAEKPKPFPDPLPTYSKPKIIKASFATKTPEPELAPIDLDDLLKTDWKFVAPAESDNVLAVDMGNVIQVIMVAAESHPDRLDVDHIYNRCTSLANKKPILPIVASFQGLIDVVRRVKAAGPAPYQMAEAHTWVTKVVGGEFKGKKYLNIKAVRG